MSNVFKLPNGGALYLAEEVETAALCVKHARAMQKAAQSEATAHADRAWASIPLWLRVYYRAKSGFFKPEEWYLAYRPKYLEMLSGYQGTGCIRLVAGAYTNDRFAADDLLMLAQSGRNVYLNPRQISVLEHLRKNSPVWLAQQNKA